jgi:hypothetical protein
MYLQNVLTNIYRRDIMKYKFEWDKEKNALNLRKHGVSFKEAAAVFSDPQRLEINDRTHSLLEERWMVVGLSITTMLTVIFTERNGFIRIISARKASKKEEEMYFYGYSTFYIN